jgi:hypothetical protein
LTIDDPLGRRLCRAVCAEAYLVARTQVDRVEPIGEFELEKFAPGDARGTSSWPQTFSMVNNSARGRCCRSTKPNIRWSGGSAF